VSRATSPPENAPARARADAPTVDREGSSVGLRLAIGRDGLGIELARRAPLACAEVVELVVRLPHVRFPFDVTGGVARFRHKRGELERVAVELDARRIARWAAPRLRGLLSTATCEVTVLFRRGGATVDVHARATAADAPATTRLPALAFEVGFAPSGEDVVVVVSGARGANLAEPPTTLALRAATALLGDVARREGARFVLSRPATAVARRLLPEAGVRAPGGEGLVLAGAGESDGVLFLAFGRSELQAEVPGDVARALEAAQIVKEGDEARLRGEHERARAHDVAALERAPRHPEIARRIAELDRRAGGRAEAAIATLRSADVPFAGVLLGDLLVEAGDVPAAIAALLRDADREPSAVLAALGYARAAELSTAGDALTWLDAAVARAPRVAELRWERARRRLLAGRLADARADLQELEGLAMGARERHAVLRRAGDIYRDAGLSGDAARFYERALLYAPDDPVALAGLGAALAGEDRPARGAALLAHAIEHGTAEGVPTTWMELELGRVLGERLGDRPAAIARLRGVPDEAREAIAARGLEGRFRAALGDDAGAALAFARLRERAGREGSALPWLLEAASFEEARGDLDAAQQHLASAVAIAPGDAAVEGRYRSVGARIAERAGLRAPALARGPEPSAEVDAPKAPAPEPPLDEAEAEARVEALTRTLQGDPQNDRVIDELTVLLLRLGRSMELLALLSARLEDAPPERRDELLPKHREVLGRLEDEARAAGRDGEADLFKMVRESS
jgi:cellulose synthase operon protein C